MVTAAVTVAGDGRALGLGVALVPTAGHAGAPATRLLDHPPPPIAASPRLVTALALAPTPARNGPQHILTSPPRARNMPLPASSPALLSFRKQHLLVELYVARP
jgi:hypothetical protein